MFLKQGADISRNVKMSGKMQMLLILLKWWYNIDHENDNKSIR